MRASSFLAQTLVKGEKIYFRGGLHWASLIKPVGVSIFFFAIYVAVLKFMDLPGGGWLWLLLLAPPLIAVKAVVTFATTEIAVTNARVLYKTGLVIRNVEEIAVKKLESVNLHQGIVGRIFHYGRLHLRGTGGGELDLKGMAAPMKMRSVIQEMSLL